MPAPYILHEKFYDPNEMVEMLWDELPWERRDSTPRFECWMNDFGTPYTYGSGAGVRTYRPVVWDEVAKTIQIELVSHPDVGTVLEGCFINGYQDGRDHLGWHSDDSPEIDATKPIAVVTFGAVREIWFRPIDDKGEEVIEKVTLPSGSLLIMKPGMQQTHQHRIPKASFTPCPPRISLTYRGLIRPLT
jgi:alkylated DNA repair dioxygenase AlkB